MNYTSYKLGHEQEQAQMPENSREFVSYATEYEMYDGHRSWPYLAVSEQDRILNAASSTDADIKALAMKIGWRRIEESGLSSILFAASHSLHSSGTIDAIDWGEDHRTAVWDLLGETPFGHRLYEAWYPETAPSIRTSIDPQILEDLAPSPTRGVRILDVANLSPAEAREELEDLLGITPSRLSDIANKAWYDLELYERILILDAAAVGNGFGLAKIKVCRAYMSREDASRTDRIISRRGSWRSRIAKFLVG